VLHLLSGKQPIRCNVHPVDAVLLPEKCIMPEPFDLSVPEEDDPTVLFRPETPDTVEDDATQAKPPSTRRLDRIPTLIERAESVLTTVTPSTVLVLQVLPSGQVITLDLSRSLVLGRRGARTGGLIQPDVDLTPLYARQHGVSRLHCALTREAGVFSVTDLGSTNGTFVNDERLEPNTPYPLSDGDLLVLGTLHILVTFNDLGISDDVQS